MSDIILDFMRHGEDNRASVPTIRLDATPSMPPSPSYPSFMPDAFPAATLPIYPGLGQAPDMLRLGYNNNDNNISIYNVQDSVDSGARDFKGMIDLRLKTSYAA